MTRAPSAGPGTLLVPEAWPSRRPEPATQMDAVGSSRCAPSLCWSSSRLLGFSALCSSLLLRTEFLTQMLMAEDRHS